ncbi:MAG: anaerobic ribonucleoside-triphosphate reductase activating protein [Ruminococcaceae bacterium]|nr:anaerobic ribonucleoside-triphosphate reductase activating protein [Oscillospiraceae bacterium]
MDFAGMQSLTLLDFPGKVACILFVRGCNLRCPFCHNASLVRPGAENAISDADVLSFLKKRQGLLDGVVISGGEPLMYPELLPFLQKVRELGYAIKVDTNGTNPDLLKKLIGEDLADYVAMDIKNSPAFYSATCGLSKVPIGDIDQSREFLMSGTVDYEFRTTAVKGLHTKESIAELSCWIAGAKRYFLQGFKDSGDLLSPANLSAFSEDEMTALLEIAKVHIPTAQLRGI